MRHVLGLRLAQYMEFYNIDHVIILGRVSKDDGGDLMLKTAGEVLKTEFPELAEITFHTADDHFKNRAVHRCSRIASDQVRGPSWP